MSAPVYDRDKVDEVTLALLFLVMTKSAGLGRASAGHDLATLERLRAKGWLGAHDRRSLSLLVTPEGVRKAEEFFRKHFTQAG